jgi:hypothetical protein
MSIGQKDDGYVADGVELCLQVEARIWTLVSLDVTYCP